MKYGVDSFTGIRPTADLTVANYIGAIRPIIDREGEDHRSAVFLAELHAATTDDPRSVQHHSLELTRTLIAAGVQSEIYSQRDFAKEVAMVEYSFRGLTSVSRLLRLPTLKEKVTQSDNPETASVSLMMYPMLMAADIVLARPGVVPTGKDQKPHLEITNELIRAFNRTYDADMPEPAVIEEKPINILSLDGSGRKMSKSIPKGAIFLSDTPDIGRRKIMKAKTASEPGEQMDSSIDNLVSIAEPLARDMPIVDMVEMRALAEQAKTQGRAGEFKVYIGQVVADFLLGINEARLNVSDAEVKARIQQGKTWFSPIAQETVEYVEAKYWGEEPTA